ncbi:hypothetical protein ACFFRR_002882 [Megaselia abdita]
MAFTQCCGCLNLRSGSLIIGALGFLGYFYKAGNEYLNRSKDNWEAVVKIMITFLGLTSMFILIIGAWIKNRNFTVVFLCLNIFVDMFTFVFYLIYPILNDLTEKEDHFEIYLSYVTYLFYFGVAI